MRVVNYTQSHPADLYPKNSYTHPTPLPPLNPLQPFPFPTDSGVPH
jgi:hypothetical protein